MAHVASTAPGRSAPPGPSFAVQPAAALRRTLAAFALHDVTLLGYLGVTGALVLAGGGAGGHAARAARELFFVAAVLVLACVAARSRAFSPAARSIGYRLVVVGTVIANYLALRDVLPVVTSTSFDAELVAADRALFGCVPALWLEPFATPGVVEYFAFFYYSYFFLCLAFTVTVLGLTSDRRARGEFGLGISLVYCAGQLGYVAVPGYGPYRALASAFRGPLVGGFFLGRVQDLVDAAGAVKDIFPSLHTAVPLYLASFAWRRAAADRRWRWPAVATTVFAVNIAVSTLVLRWHHAVDVLAGAALAGMVALAAPRLARWEAARRARRGLPDAWDFD